MEIKAKHRNIGAALMQIAEHKQFTAINALKIRDEKIINAFKVNDDILIYCKYASEPQENDEYVFNLKDEHIDNIGTMKKQSKNLFMVLICVEAREICCMSYKQLMQLIGYRKKSAREIEDQYNILVSLASGKDLGLMLVPMEQRTK
jgi:hypothetical protein